MYKAHPLGGYIRTADQARIPNDECNADYQKVQKWIAKGNKMVADDKVQKIDLLKAGY